MSPVAAISALPHEIRSWKSLHWRNKPKAWHEFIGRARHEAPSGNSDGDYFALSHSAVQCFGAASGCRSPRSIFGRDRSGVAAMAGVQGRDPIFLPGPSFVAETHREV